MWRIFWAKYFHNISNFKFLEEGINSSISNVSQKELIRGKGGGGGGGGGGWGEQSSEADLKFYWANCFNFFIEWC